METTLKLCELLDVEPNITVTDHYVDADAADIDDFRDAIRPKHPLPDPDFTPKPYYQVHNLRQGFQPNMSALDLLFNEGPEGVLHL